MPVVPCPAPGAAPPSLHPPSPPSGGRSPPLLPPAGPPAPSRAPPAGSRLQAAWRSATGSALPGPARPCPARFGPAWPGPARPFPAPRGTSGHRARLAGAAVPSRGCAPLLPHVVLSSLCFRFVFFFFSPLHTSSFHLTPPPFPRPAPPQPRRGAALHFTGQARKGKRISASSLFN